MGNETLCNHSSLGNLPHSISFLTYKISSTPHNMKWGCTYIFRSAMFKQPPLYHDHCNSFLSYYFV